jgi:uncharacterized membrane protein
MPTKKKKPAPRKTAAKVVKTAPKKVVSKKVSKSRFRFELRQETAAALTYLLGPVTGIFFLLVDRRKEVRTQAWQSILLILISFGIAEGLYWSYIGILLLPPFVLAVILIWIVAIWRAAAGIHWRMPIIFRILSWVKVVR